MNSRARFLFSAVLILATVFLAVRFFHTSTAAAQSAPASIALPARWSYAAKFVCGFQSASTTAPPAEPGVKLGNYATVINIHNPWQGTATLEKKVVVAYPERYPHTSPTDPTKRFSDQLVSDHTLSVDCTEIVNLLTLNGTPPPPAVTFIEGFVVIDSWIVNPPGTTTAVPMDIVEVTSASQNLTSPVVSHQILTVVGRQLPAGVWPF